MSDFSDIEESFWGVRLEPKKKYSQIVDKSVHVSMAAIDPSANGSKELTSLWFERDTTSYLICTLGASNLQQHLDLNFNEGENVALYTKGTGTIHLTGYLHLDTDFASDDDDYHQGEGEGSDDDDFDDDEAEEVEAKEIEIVKKRKLEPKVSHKVKKTKMMIQADSDEEDGADDDDDDDEEEKPPVKASPKPEKKKKEEQSSPQKPEGKEGGGVVDGEKKKKKKKKKKKSKESEGSEGDGGSKPTPQKGESKKRVLEGGVLVESLKEGHGPEAVSGKHVKVYYTGKLESGKIFDAKTSGSPFAFKLGKKEVIAGWDVGVAGMKVGGKRKLTIPAKMAYGGQKLAGIPPNSTLIFDVELKAVR